MTPGHPTNYTTLTDVTSTSASALAGPARLGLNIFNQVAGAQSAKASRDIERQRLLAQQRAQELQLEEQKLATEKALAQGLARVNNSAVDASTRSSLAEAMNAQSQSQIASATAQNALSMQRIGAGLTQARIEKANAGRKLFNGLFDKAGLFLGSQTDPAHNLGSNLGRAGAQGASSFPGSSAGGLSNSQRKSQSTGQIRF